MSLPREERTDGAPGGPPPHHTAVEAIALGHPLGCTGAKLTAQILHELGRRNGRFGVVSMCIGGGMGAAGLFERIA